MDYSIDKIVWTDPKAKISEHFTVKDALYLPSWQIFHTPSEEEKKNILAMAEKMELIREFLGGKPIHVNCWTRPEKVNSPKSFHHGQSYNRYVRGAPGSAHKEGKAVDFVVSKMTCDDVRECLRFKLEEFKLRCEDMPGSGWVHCDIREPAILGAKQRSRFFRP